MIPKDCKRLAEVDFPIVAVSKHAVHEQEQHDAHPKVLHMWWARRPLASSRAVLLALLWPDPCDALCPADFKTKAREILRTVLGQVGSADVALRNALLKFISDFANWDLAANRTYVEVARALVKAAHGDESPLVVDPFAGGGSIPLEALRVGCDAFASDLNPVSCLILKVLLEDIQRHGPQLADQLRSSGAEIKEASAKNLDRFYPADADGARPIAYLWARTVRCESPKCGAEIPLVRSFWLSKNANRRRALHWNVLRRDGRVPSIEFAIFSPETEDEVPSATVKGARAMCPACSGVLPPERVRAQLREQHGGADATFDAAGRRVGGARLLAVVTLKEGEQGRRFRLPTDHDYQAIRDAEDALQVIDARPRSNGISAVPDELLPAPGTLGFRVQRYGMTRWRDLFTARQKLALLTVVDEASRALARPDTEATRRLVGLAVSKLTNLVNAGAPWKIDRECPVSLIAGQRVPPLWDWCEAVPLSDSSGSLISSIDRVAEAVSRSWVLGSDTALASGTTRLADAVDTGLPDGSAAVYFTDPPYYNAVPYADLSDFYFVWLKRLLANHGVERDPFDVTNPLTPKNREAVQDESKLIDGKPKDRAFFESRMALAFSEGRRVLDTNGIGCIVFAHKTTEGWEALLSAVVAAGWVITGSWPIATEMRSRLRARASAALATSVHLVCRPRAEDATVGDWAATLRELPRRVSDWMDRLQREGVRGADLVFSCIGPALEIFSRYATVETAEGREVALAEYLEKVWEVVGRSALAQVLGTAEARARNGAAGAVEEDARLTALFLWTLQSTNDEATDIATDGDDDEELSAAADDHEESSSSGKAKGYTLVYDVVRRFAQPLGIELPKWEGRVIETKKGVVRLLPIGERAKQLFGEHGAQAVAARLELEATVGNDPLQGMLFPEMQRGGAPAVRGRGRGRAKRSGIEVPDESLTAAREATTLDRVHAAMLLQAGGRTNALRALLRAEQERGPDFLRLANALSALYPKGSEEKRLLDAMLLAMPR